jgi:hypothetical protein
MTSTSSTSSDSVREALRVIFDASSTFADKLRAVELLETVSTDQALDALEHVLDVVYAPAPGELVNDGLPELPVITDSVSDPEGLTPIAERAARALARNEHPEGIEYLMVALNSESASLQYRIVAALGLGGCIRPHAFEALAFAIHDHEAAVRSQALNSLRESLDRVGNKARSRLDVVRAMDSLLTLAMTPGNRGDLAKEANAAVAREILRQFYSPSLENRVVETLKGMRKEDDFSTTVEILEGRMSLDTARLLAEYLVEIGRPPPVYLSIGKALAGSRDAYIRQLAESILNENNNIIGTMRNLISTRRSTITSVRREAARWILVG